MLPSLDFLRISFGFDAYVETEKDQPKLLASETKLFSCYFCPLTVYCRRQSLSKCQNMLLMQASSNILLCS